MCPHVLLSESLDAMLDVMLVLAYCHALLSILVFAGSAMHVLSPWAPPTKGISLLGSGAV
jgi:hypothetical protein